MKIKLEEIANIATSSTATYYSNDFALDVRITYPHVKSLFSEEIDKKIGIKDETFQLIYGSLTITFAGRDLFISSIDGYTNREKWKLESVAVPTTSRLEICFVASLAAEDPCSSAQEPSYYFDGTKQMLKIKLTKSDSEVYYRLSDNLIVGMSRDSISSIFLLNMILK